MGSRKIAERSMFLLDETQIPTQWYNVIPHLPSPPPPPLHPGTRQPVGPDDLAPLFPMALIEQEVTTASYVDIPGGVLDVYRRVQAGPHARPATRSAAGRQPGGSSRTLTNGARTSTNDLAAVQRQARDIAVNAGHVSAPT